MKALKVYEEWKPDIIILDIMLPETSGFSVLKEIREQQKDLYTTIIIASVLSDREDILQCAKYGIQGYLIKPINLEELNTKILKLHGDSHPDKIVQVMPFMQDS
jgi:DNA-binding response OmpR family regulator